MNKYFTWKNILICLTIIVIIVVAYFYKPSKENNQSNYVVEKTSNIKTKENKSKIFVDIKGAVKKPGVYELDENSIVLNVIDQAGGLTKSATTKNINLSKKIFSEMVIYVFTTSELKKSTVKTENNVYDCKCETIKIDSCINNEETNNSDEKEETNSNNLLVNINSASLNELQSLPGIGLTKAEAIINYRLINGNYLIIDDLKKVSGIGESTFNNIKDKITV